MWFNLTYSSWVKGVVWGLQKRLNAKKGAFLWLFSGIWGCLLLFEQYFFKVVLENSCCWKLKKFLKKHQVLKNMVPFGNIYILATFTFSIWKHNFLLNTVSDYIESLYCAISKPVPPLSSHQSHQRCTSREGIQEILTGEWICWMNWRKCHNNGDSFSNILNTSFCLKFYFYF